MMTIFVKCYIKDRQVGMYGAEVHNMSKNVSQYQHAQYTNCRKLLATTAASYIQRSIQALSDSLFGALLPWMSATYGDASGCG